MSTAASLNGMLISAYQRATLVPGEEQARTMGQ